MINDDVLLYIARMIGIAGLGLLIFITERMP